MCNHAYMRNQAPGHILALVILSILFSAECSYSRRPSLRLRVLPDPTLSESTTFTHVTYHLLNDDPLYLVMNGEDEHTPRAEEVYRANPRLRVLAGKLNARRFGGYSLGPDVFLFMDQSQPLWQPHVIRSGQANVNGYTQLDDLKPGNCWLMVYSHAQGKQAFWLQYLTVKNGATEIVLEPVNALYFQ